MNHDLEVALAAAKGLRDLGNFVLLIGILGEVAIDVFWPEGPSLLHLLPTKPYIKFRTVLRDHLHSWRTWIVFVVGLVVLYGLYLERVKGREVDDLSDQIRTNLQQRIIQDSPRSWQLQVPEATERFVSALKPFATQKIAIVVFNGTYGQDQEGGALAITIAALLMDCDWSDAMGQKLKVDRWSNPHSFITFAPMPKYDNGLEVEVHENADKPTKAAAEALRAALEREQLLIVRSTFMAVPIPQKFLPPMIDEANTVILVVFANPALLFETPF